MPQKRTYIIFIISLATSILMIGIFIHFFIVIKNANEVAATLSQNINDEIAQQNNISTLQKNITDTKQQSESLKSYIVDKNNVDTFITWVENQGTVIGVPTTTNSVAFTTNNTLTAEFTGTGTFAQVARLEALIEYAPYKIHITKVSINRVVPPTTALNTKASPANNQWQIDIGFKVVSNNTISS